MRNLLLTALFTTMSFAASSVHEFTLDSMDGKATPLASYKGKVLLLVNVASKCGYTPQYSGLQSLYEKYKDKGLVVVGIPANNFGGQEPGSNEEIKQFCSRTYNVTFPMMKKVSVKGSDMTPLYGYLTSNTGGDVSGTSPSFWSVRMAEFWLGSSPRSRPTAARSRRQWRRHYRNDQAR